MKLRDAGERRRVRDDMVAERAGWETERAALKGVRAPSEKAVETEALSQTVIVAIVRDRFDALLPELLDRGAPTLGVASQALTSVTRPPSPDAPPRPCGARGALYARLRGIKRP